MKPNRSSMNQSYIQPLTHTGLQTKAEDRWWFSSHLTWLRSSTSQGAMQCLKAQRSCTLFSLEGATCTTQHPTWKHLALYTITDLSVPGWISNTPNGQDLLNRVRSSEPPAEALCVFDILDNSLAHFRQDDGGSSLLIKLNGGFHVLGELEMMQHNHEAQALFPVEHLYKNWLRSNCKVFIPPIPRFVFGSAGGTYHMALTSGWRIMEKRL